MGDEGFGTVSERKLTIGGAERREERFPIVRMLFGGQRVSLNLDVFK